LHINLYNNSVKKKQPKTKLQNKGRIKRRLLTLWSKKAHEIHNNCCAICGLKTGDIVDGKKQKIDAHHVEDKTNYSLRFDIRNSILLCVWHHKFGKNSAHRSPIFFIDWMEKNRPKQILYVREHRNDDIDTDSREYLAQLEVSLKGPISEKTSEILNLKDLDDLEGKKEHNPLYNPIKESKKKKESPRGHLFEDLEEINSSSSSES